MVEDAQGDAQTLAGGEDPGAGGTLTAVSTHQGPRTPQCPLLTEQKRGAHPAHQALPFSSPSRVVEQSVAGWRGRRRLGRVVCLR